MIIHYFVRFFHLPPLSTDFPLTSTLKALQVVREVTLVRMEEVTGKSEPINGTSTIRYNLKKD